MSIKKTVRGLFLTAALAVTAASAQAFSLDPQIMIDRALNSPTLTVRYAGVHATLVELRINGESLGTRTVEGGRANGETNFTVNTSDLKDGDNAVLIRLFDQTGKVVAEERSNISTYQNEKGPVFIEAPKVGQSVRGPIEIKAGLSENIRNAYVSFFVDGNFKSLSNYPPFVFNWDTERESNGWHELEAWAIDGSNDTQKSRKIRVFVNNPSGRTNRTGVVAAATPSRNRIRDAILASSEAGLKNLTTGGTSRTENRSTDALAPAVVDRLTPKANVGTLTIGAAAGRKPVAYGSTVSSGPKLMTPTGKRIVETSVLKMNLVKKDVVVAATPASAAQTVATNLSGIGIAQSAVRDVVAASSLIRVEKGTRLPNLATFAVLLDGSYVNFDVNPRVDDGIPMTPFRHLFEKAGGKVTWDNFAKQVHAKADGKDIDLKIGNASAKLNANTLTMEKAAYLDRGRTVVPVSFMREALNVDVQFDRETNHVLITSTKK